MKLNKADLWALVIPLVLVGGLMGLYFLMASANRITSWLDVLMR